VYTPTVGSDNVGDWKEKTSEIVKWSAEEFERNALK
jgi:hypothetical protein